MSSKGYFNQIASEWDNMRKGFFSEEVREKAFLVANVQKDELAADIGAGISFMRLYIKALNKYPTIIIARAIIPAKIAIS